MEVEAKDILRAPIGNFHNTINMKHFEVYVDLNFRFKTHSTMVEK